MDRKFVGYIRMLRLILEIISTKVHIYRRGRHFAGMGSKYVCTLKSTAHEIIVLPMR